MGNAGTHRTPEGGMAGGQPAAALRGGVYQGASKKELIGVAAQKTGIRPIQGDIPHQALDILVSSYRQNNALTPRGRLLCDERLVGRLINRLRIRRTLERFPSIRGEQIVRPLIVTGIPRSGTTLLQRLLAMDPNSRCLPFWEAMRPAPPDWPVPRERDPRIEYAARVSRAASQSPIHMTNAWSPEECCLLLANSMVHEWFCMHVEIPQYAEWLQTQDRLRGYHFYYLQLQMLQFAFRRKHWVLKAPSHLSHLDALLTVMPDACVVQTHRDPLKCVPSMCSLSVAARNAHATPEDPKAVGPRVLSLLAGIDPLGKAWKVRASRDASQFFDVHYPRLVEDPVATVRGIYEAFGYEYSSAFEERVRGYLVENPKNKHGVHRYSLEEFGLDREGLQEAFAAYCERHGIEPEA